VFTMELRAALERCDCDVAVHSYKDLPTARDERFAPIAVPPRVDPSDVLIARDGLTLDTLPEGARVGTSAPRRRSQLAAVRPDLDLRPLRGNIDTRMGYVTDGELDAVVLAAAGLDRVGVGERATQRFGIDQMLPSPAQGALAVEARADDDEAAAAVALLDHLPSRTRVVAERRLLADLEAGCTAPVGARAVRRSRPAARWPPPTSWAAASRRTCSAGGRATSWPTSSPRNGTRSYRENPRRRHRPSANPDPRYSHFRAQPARGTHTTER